MTALEVRREQRRSTLLAAAIELLGAATGPAVTVRAVCTKAGLTERYFYESFGDRDSLVRAAYDHVASAAHRALTSAVAEAADPIERASRAVTAFVELMVDDPSKGHVLLIAPFADPALSDVGLGAVPGFVALVGDQLPAEVDDVDRQLIATGIVGALTGLFSAYLRGELAADRRRFVEHCVAVTVR
ncbi:TetR/AcrR family transcriptional regulator [Actinomycetes bacterium M1A6_2h]